MFLIHTIYSNKNNSISVFWGQHREHYTSPSGNYPPSKWEESACFLGERNAKLALENLPDKMLFNDGERVLVNKKIYNIYMK